MKNTVRISITETPQFHRIVEFIGDVQARADKTDDDVLRSMVSTLGEELLAMATECGDE